MKTSGQHELISNFLPWMYMNKCKDDYLNTSESLAHEVPVGYAADLLISWQLHHRILSLLMQNSQPSRAALASIWGQGNLEYSSLYLVSQLQKKTMQHIVTCGSRLLIFRKKNNQLIHDLKTPAVLRA